MARVLKWVGIIFGSLLVLIVIAAFVMSSRGNAKLTRTFTAQSTVGPIPTDSQSIALGKHVMRIHGCQVCHGENLGGTVFLDIPLIKAVATNLTAGKGGVGGRFSDADWDNAIRHGVRPGGAGLVPMMPFKYFSNISDHEAAALIAYLKQIPAVDNELPKTQLKMLGNIIFGMLPDEELRGDNTSPPKATPAYGTAEYGDYLTRSTCRGCHGPNLEGSKAEEPGAPNPPGIRLHGSWPLEKFTAAVREGKVDGRTLSDAMPWKHFADLSDLEVKSLHEYLKTLINAPAPTVK